MRSASIATISLIAVVLVLSLVPAPASAQLQDIAFSLDCPPGPDTIRPLSAPGSWECTARLEYKSARTGLTDPTQPAIIGLEFPDHPPWMRPVVSPDTVVSFGAGPGQEVVEQPVRVTVGLTADAPAFQTTNLWLRPYVIQHPREEGELSKFTTRAHTNLSVTAGYVSIYTVRLVDVKTEARPQEPLRYNIEIENFSNGPTRFQFSSPAGNLSQGFQVLPPDTVVVPGRGTAAGAGDPFNPNGTEGGQGDASTDGNVTRTAPGRVSLPLEVYTPYHNGYVNQRAPIQIQVDSFYGPNLQIQGVSSVVSTLGTAKGVYTPGPGAPLAILFLAAGALVVRRQVA